MAKAKLVLHHDDPPCSARLIEGFCPECGVFSDMQSRCLISYCPDCILPLKNLKCSACGQEYALSEGITSTQHFISKSCKGEKCSMCKSPATHKVGEELFDDDPNLFRHIFTAYVCCEHFRLIMGPAVMCAHSIA